MIADMMINHSRGASRLFVYERFKRKVIVIVLKSDILPRFFSEFTGRRYGESRGIRGHYFFIGLYILF
jgi:hypothetical protein